MNIDDLSVDAVWVAEDVRRRSGARGLARFTFQFSEEKLRVVARVLAASGFYCIRLKGSKNRLTIEAPIDGIANAVGTCLEHDGEYVSTVAWLS